MADDIQTIQVECPCCQATLTVDAATGEVLMHKEAARQGPKVDITQAVQDLKKGAGRRDELFKKSLEAEKNKSDSLRKKFNEAFKKAQENPDAPPPKRDIDLD